MVLVCSWYKQLSQFRDALIYGVYATLFPLCRNLEENDMGTLGTK
jgi:hypothetical protein